MDHKEAAWLHQCRRWARLFARVAGLLVLTVSTASGASGFNWPIPSEAKVREVRHPPGGPPVEIRYTIRLGWDDSPNELVLRLIDTPTFRADDEVVPGKELDPFVHVFQPDIRIDYEGLAIGLVDELSVRENLAAAFRALASARGDEDLADFMSSPEIIDIALARSLDRWAHWQSALIDAPTEPGESIVSNHELPSALGVVQARSQTWFEGHSPQRPGLLRYRMESDFVDEDLGQRTSRLVENWVDEFAKSGTGDKPPAMAPILDLDRSDTIVADVEPTTLRPVHVEATMRITVADTTGKSQVKEEKVEYAFEWLSDADRNDRVRQRPATELPPPADRTHAVPAMRYATVHPQRALRDGRTGTVLLELQVGTDGEVLDADIVRSSGFGPFDEEALVTVMAWRFHPALHGATPVQSKVRQPIEFGIAADAAFTAGLCDRAVSCSIGLPEGADAAGLPISGAMSCLSGITVGDGSDDPVKYSLSRREGSELVDVGITLAGADGGHSYVAAVPANGIPVRLPAVTGGPDLNVTLEPADGSGQMWIDATDQPMRRIVERVAGLFDVEVEGIEAMGEQRLSMHFDAVSPDALLQLLSAVAGTRHAVIDRVLAFDTEPAMWLSPQEFRSRHRKPSAKVRRVYESAAKRYVDLSRRGSTAEIEIVALDGSTTKGTDVLITEGQGRLREIRPDRLTIGVGNRACYSVGEAPWTCSDTEINYSLPAVDWEVVGRSGITKVDCAARKPCLEVLVETMRSRVEDGDVQVSGTQVDRRVRLLLSGDNGTPLHLMEEESYGSLGFVQATREFGYPGTVEPIELPQDGTTAEAREPRIVEVRPAGGGAFDWRGRSWTASELQTQLEQDASAGPTSELRLLESPVPASVGDILALGMVAKAIGARAYYQDGTEFRAISVAE
ncbi:MAG: energy transducer TonB [Xanthomonadales bacterium]|nr:energy transducer TonB [Xanthomonadales bacterium]